MLLENQTSSAAAAPLVARLAEMLEAARANADTRFDVTKRLVAEASLLLELHLARNMPTRTRQHAQGGLARWQIDRVRTFIDAHLAECVRVSDLSRLVRSSPSYFSAAFKRTFGASPHAYLMTRRISLAVELMLSSDAPLSEIAINCGFADQAHFTRTFKKLRGMTPGYYRRGHLSL